MKVIIIGAGAAGIMAANVLAKRGVSVTILEAANRIGGRIHTFIPEGFVNTVEAGAEFIHGSLPLTLKLLQKAKLTYVGASMTMYRSNHGKIVKSFGNSKAWDSFYEKLAALEQDCTLDDFLNTHFPGVKYKLLHSEVRDMVQGLDLADPAGVSLLSLKDEWLSEEPQYRPLTGYRPLLEHLYNEAASHTCSIKLGQKVSAIEWKPGNAKVITSEASYDADAVIVTASLGILKNKEIAFLPDLPELPSYLDEIGFGHVIKIAMEFGSPFWEQQYPEMGFLFTEKGLTFWTQLEQRIPLLTGWIGNDDAARYGTLSDDNIVGICLEQLQQVFPDVISHFRNAVVFRHTENSPSRGGYSWPKPESKQAVKKINKGFGNTIWFAGEAFDPTFETATVEAALQSGKYVAGKVLKALKQ